MDANNSLLSLLLSRRFDAAAMRRGPSFDSRQIFRDYVVRQVNLLQWFSLIAITILLLKQLARALDLRRKGNRISGPSGQSLYDHLLLLVGNNPQEYLTGKTSTGQQC